jgi:UDP-N-acetylmuramoyl-tripeptide--D-alanyl-D-alanine ligase
MLLNEAFLRKAIPYCSLLIGKNFVARDSSPSIDTRTIAPGDLFIALPGEHGDGHNFLPEAAKKGAIGFLIKQSNKNVLNKLSSLDNLIIILVPDPMEALIDLAKSWRKKFSYPVVGITGSIGKTTTKEMIHSILESANLPACVSYKNQNTLLGLCINILKMKKHHHAAILEIGISRLDEMEQKIDILRPNIGVITSIAHSHMEFLGQLPEIAKEKLKLFSLFGPGDIGIIFGDQELLDKAYYTHPVIRFGTRTKNLVQARKIRVELSEGLPTTHFVLKLYKEKRNITLKTNHKGYVLNALAASALAHQLRIPLDHIVSGLQAYNGFEGRFERRKLKKNKGLLIHDCYNANPESMREALIAAHETSVSGQKVAVIGDMLELGEKAIFWHRQIGRVLSKTLSITEVILVGKLAKNIADTAPITANIEFASEWNEALEKLKPKLTGNNLVLVKGSLAMDLKNLVEKV